MAAGGNRESVSMSISLQIIIGIAIGMVLGAFNYSLLWLTVRTLLVSNRPGLIALFSFLVRMAVIILAFYLLTIGAGWISAVSGLAGLILVRAIMVRRFGPERGSYRPEGERKP
jgi:F1F0 ATPase subunit 2